MKKILVPLDFSESAEKALKLADYWAKNSGGELLILHVIDAPTMIDIQADLESIKINYEANTLPWQEKVKEIQEKIKESTKNINSPLKVHICSGEPYSKIISLLLDQHIDLIIMGTKGNNQKNVFLGSTAEKVLRQAPCPVLSVRSSHKENFELKNIVWATSLSGKTALPSQQILEIQKIFNANLHLVYVNTANNFSSTKELESKAKKFIEDNELKNAKFHIYCDVLQDEGIRNFAKQLPADLVILVSHQRQGLSRFWHGSVSEGVVGEAYIPVLTFPMYQ